MVTVKEPFEEIIMRAGVEVSRKPYISEILYCDDCGEEITDKGYDAEHVHEPKCILCEKDLCKDHRHNFPSDDAPVDPYAPNKKFICDRCKNQFAKELNEYAEYLIVLSELENAVTDYKRKMGERFDHPFGKRKIGHYENLQWISKDLKEKTHRQIQDKKYRMEKKLKR